MHSQNHGLKLLVADDEVDIGEIVQEVADSLGFEVKYTSEGSQVLRLAGTFNPHVIALDLRMPDADGVEIIRELAKSGSDAAIILMSGMDQRTLTSVQKLGADSELNMIGTLTKPMSIDAIENLFEKCIEIKKSLRGSSASDAEARTPGFGLQPEYQPELILAGDAPISRFFVDAKWRMDNGILLTGTQYTDWANKTGSSKGLTFLMLERAVSDFRRNSSHDLNNEFVIKLDVALVKDLDLPDYFSRLVAAQHIPAENFTFQVDEELLFVDEDKIIDVLSRLRIKGFKVAINARDEGESVLAMLDQLPIDILTLDIAHAQSANKRTSDMEVEFMYSSLTSLASHKDVQVCALNVHSKELLELARKCHFNSVRGEYITALHNAQPDFDAQPQATIANR